VLGLKKIGNLALPRLKPQEVSRGGLIEKMNRGYNVDGVAMLAANCGGGGLTGPGGSGGASVISEAEEESWSSM
jgi:hypothetical protein